MLYVHVEFLISYWDEYVPSISSIFSQTIQLGCVITRGQFKSIWPGDAFCSLPLFMVIYRMFTEAAPLMLSCPRSRTCANSQSSELSFKIIVVH